MYTNSAYRTCDLGPFCMWDLLWTPKGDLTATVGPILVDCGMEAKPSLESPQTSFLIYQESLLQHLVPSSSFFDTVDANLVALEECLRWWIRMKLVAKEPKEPQKDDIRASHTSMKATRATILYRCCLWDSMLTTNSFIRSFWWASAAILETKETNGRRSVHRNKIDTNKIELLLAVLLS